MKRYHHRSGRRARKKRRNNENLNQTVSLCHQSQYVELMKFLHQRQFTLTPLQPVLFTDTGRGLQSLKTIKSGELIISLPASCLITTSTVLNSYVGQYIKSCNPRCSALLVLCVFLLCERHRGEASDWFSYINVLPKSYTCPVYFTEDIMDVLPASLQRQAIVQREMLQELYSSSQDIFRSLQPVLSQPTEEVFTYDAVRWAWCSVNTRSVFMAHPSNDFLSGKDVYALAPFLDLLNHHPGVQVKAGFNTMTGCYEIRSIHGVRRYQQAFINYGSHDNQRLLLEYGFVAPGNPHSVVYVDEDLLSDIMRSDKSLNQKMKFLRGNNLLQNLTVSNDGPSWRLMTALRLFSMPQTLYHEWKSVLHGQSISEGMEEWCVSIAERVCQRILLGTNTALDKITGLLQHCDPPIREQLNVVQSLREEERCILTSCLDVLKGSRRRFEEAAT